jgi:eukaryotic-like serine/threonine-protein kinase
MNPERWQQIEEIFQIAVEYDPRERQAYLTQVCAGDTELRREVESLLAHEKYDTFIEDPIKSTAHMIAAETAHDLIGQQLGPYRVTELLGEGGMGAVYAAMRADAEFQQRVAIKVVRRGMDTRFILNRFRHERQILAALDHPNIARLLDGGTTADGLPYFVMEYIAGQPLHEYCAAQQLSLTDRLKLFRQVCSAVQYAHQKLVVHRDLKPGNVLVNEQGVPKLLDFGIAKLLDNSQGGGALTQTATQMRMLTPDYASPEQVRGQQITTASDVYSLGAVLYELLTGQRPHRFQTFTQAEVERVVCETEVERPSAAVKRLKAVSKGVASSRIPHPASLKGDLDNIILMALRKEPARRYQSVEHLSDDLLRYLEGRPVSARRDTLGYRTGKFVRRHKAVVAVAALALLSLVGGLIAVNYQARRAERRFQQVRKLANTFLFDFHERIEKLPGATPARELVITTALEYLDNLAQEAQDDAALQLELAQAYLKVGDLQGNPWAANLGQTAMAAQSYRKALSLAEQHATQRRQPAQARHAALRVAAQAQAKLGILQAEGGDKRGGLAVVRQALHTAESLRQQTGAASDAALVAALHGHLGDILIDTNQITEALHSHLRSLAWTQQQAQQTPKDEMRVALARDFGRVAQAQAALGELVQARANFQQATAIYEVLVQREPHNLGYQRGLRANYSWLGSVAGSPVFPNLGETAAAIEYGQRALRLATASVAQDPQNVLFQSDLILTHVRLGDVLQTSAPAQALAQFRQAVAVAERLRARVPGDFKVQVRHAIAQTRLAAQLCRSGQCRTALPVLEQARDAMQRLAAQDPINQQLQADLRMNLSALAEAYLQTGEHAQALAHAQQALASAEKLRTDSPQDVNVRWWLIEAYAGWARYEKTLAQATGTTAAERANHWRAARDWQARALAQWDEWRAQGAASIFTVRGRAQTQRELAACEAALAALPPTGQPASQLVRP